MSAPDPALWLLVGRATRTSAGQTAETFLMRDRLLDVVARYERCGIEHRAGHAFEVLSTWSFNVDALRVRADVRAEWCGPMNGPADIRIVDGGDRVVAQVQTKLMDDPVATAGSLRADRYAGMRRVVAGDKVDDVRRYLRKGVGAFNPDGEIHAGYVDAESNLADRIEVGGVRSTSMTRAEVHRVAEHPGRWAAVRSAQAVGRQVGVAVVTGVGVGAVVGGGIAAVAEGLRVHAGETTPADAVWTVAATAGSITLRAGAVAGLGEVVRIAARRLPAGSAVPVAVASTMYDAAAAGIAFSRGEIGTVEFALRGGESVLGTVAAGAFAAAGQAVVPFPGVGFVLGGLVGQLASAAVAGWVRSAIGGTDEPVAEPAAIEAVPAADDLLAQVDMLIREVAGWVAGVFSEVAARVEETVPDGAIEDGFDAWMSDAGSALVLDPNPA